MAIGDAAASHGIPVVPGTRSINIGYQDINAVADAVAAEQDTRFTAVQNEATQRISTDTVLGQAIDQTNAALAGKQANLGFVPVRQTSTMTIGWRFQDAANTGTGYPRLIVLIGGTEYEVPILLDVIGAEARLNARMSRNGIGA